MIWNALIVALFASNVLTQVQNWRLVRRITALELNSMTLARKLFPGIFPEDDEPPEDKPFPDIVGRSRLQ